MLLGRLLIFVFLILRLLSTSALAYMPSEDSFSESFKNAEVVFVGRIVGLKETERKESYTKVKADISIIKCLKGRICEETRETEMEYYSESILDNILPVEFFIGQNNIFLLNNVSNMRSLKFNSKVGEPTDYAFEILSKATRYDSNLLDGIILSKKVLSIKNMFWDKPEIIELEEVIKEH